jgi:hypothetical protein
MTEYYRICERKQSKLFTLFHAFGMPRSRELPMNEWLNAEIKPVYDGSKKTAKQYTSGFHVFEDPEECARFIKMFHAPRELVMVKVLIGDTWPKSHSRSNVLLTDKMKIIKVIKRLNQMR